jgi:hypothetical protein
MQAVHADACSAIGYSAVSIAMTIVGAVAFLAMLYIIGLWG